MTPEISFLIHRACTVTQPVKKNGYTEKCQRIVRHVEVVMGKGDVQRRAFVFSSTPVR